VDIASRPWLMKAPQLRAAYLVFVNRSRRRLRRRLNVAVALSIAWIFVVSMYMHAYEAVAISITTWLNLQSVLVAGVFAFVSCALISRRRAVNKKEATSSWVASLPVERSTLIWQAMVIESAPVVAAVGIMVAAFGSLSIVETYWRSDLPTQTMRPLSLGST
jgi:FtsH-binding integral membrane protein